MAERTTLDQALEAWKRAPRRVVSDHLAESTLVDLIHQELSPEEEAQALQHLAACSICSQALKGLLKCAGTAPVRRTQELRAAAASQSGEQVLRAEDTMHQLVFLEERDEDGRFLTLRVKFDARPAFEGKLVTVWNGDERPLCTGRITSGTMSCELEEGREIVPPLTCTAVPDTE